MGQGPKTPHAAAHYGFYVFRPTPPLASFDRGVDMFLPVVAHLEAHGQQLPRWSPMEDAPVTFALGLLSPAVVLQTVAPLALMVLLTSAIARERDAGTLRIALAQGVPPRTLVIGKVVAVGGMMLASLAPGVLTIASVVIMRDGASPSSWNRLLALALVYGLFLWTFGAFVALLTIVLREGKQALLAGTVVWTLMVFVAPRGIADVAARWFPVPTPDELASVAAADAAERPSYWDDRVPAVTRRLLAEHGVDRAEELPVNPTVVALIEEEEWDSERATRRIESVWSVHRVRERFSAVVSAFVPASNIQDLSRAFAGTDAAHGRHFMMSAEQYRRSAMRTINEAGVHERYADVLQGGQRYIADSDVWDSVPAFVHQPPPLAAVVREQRASILAQTVWAAVLTVFVAWRAQRLGVV